MGRHIRRSGSLSRSGGGARGGANRTCGYGASRCGGRVIDWQTAESRRQDWRKGQNLSGVKGPASRRWSRCLEYRFAQNTNMGVFSQKAGCYTNILGRLPIHVQFQLHATRRDFRNRLRLFRPRREIEAGRALHRCRTERDFIGGWWWQHGDIYMYIYIMGYWYWITH